MEVLLWLGAIVIVLCSFYAVGLASSHRVTVKLRKEREAKTFSDGSFAELPEAEIHSTVSSYNLSYVKRAFDIIISFLLIIIFSPFLLVIMIFIKVSSRGPVFFSHQRIGKDRKTFQCLKFRTMVPDAEKRLDALLKENPELSREWSVQQKLRADPRVEPLFGQFLRSSSLDELPQLLNVLRGDMSIVGPRPVTEEELQLYGNWIPVYLSVKPGLTGPWQASYQSGASFQSRVAMDVDYIVRANLAEDVKVIADTVKSFSRMNSL